MVKSSLALAVVFGAMLIMSLVAMVPVPPAEALTAATFTDKTTFTSLTSGSWDRVWTNTAGTATYFLDSSGASFKSVKVNTTGSVTQTATGVLVGGGTTLTSTTGSTTKHDVQVLQARGASTEALRTTSNTFVVEFANGATSDLVGKTVNEAHVWIKKTGTPGAPTTATVAVFDANGNTAYSFGTINCDSGVTTSFVEYTFRGAFAGRTIANGDRIGVFFNGGSVGNTCDVEYVNADAYDGTSLSILQTATGAQGAASWTSQTGRELHMQLSFNYVASFANDNDGGVSYWENSGYAVRGTQTDFDGSTSLRTGSTTIAAEKVAGGTLSGVSYDTIEVFLKKTGSPTGTYTVGRFDSSGNTLFTCNTGNAASLTTTATRMSFTCGSDDTITATSYIGVQYTGGSVGNTVDMSRSGSDVFDGAANAVRSDFAGSWTDSTGNDMSFRIIDTANVAGDQESGAFIKWDAGSNVATGGVKVYWTDAAKIPSSVTLSTSTDDVSYTDRVTISPTQAVGFEYLELDASYSVRYVKMTVATWGASDFSMAVGEFQRLPTVASFSTVSAVETVGGTNRVYYLHTDNAGADLHAFGIIDIDTGQIIASGTQSHSAGGNGFGSIVSTKNKVYFLFLTNVGASAAYALYNANRDLTSPTLLEATSTSTGSLNAFECEVGTNGAAAAQDVIYCAVAAASTNKVWKITTAGKSDLLSDNSAPWTLPNDGMVPLSDKLVLRYTVSGTDTLKTITKSTDAISAALFTSTWLTKATQQFDFDGTTITFKAGSIAYYANANKAIEYSSAGTLTEQGRIYIESVTPGSGTLTGLNDAVIYRLSDTLVVTGTTTTWTPRTITSANQLAPVPYTEKLNVDLVSNYTIFAASLVKVECDASYTLLDARTYYVGSDSDCVNWRIVPTSTDTVGRLIPYTDTAEVVHANPQTSYTVQLSASGDLSVYFLRTIYDGVDVDTGAFDSGGAVGQHLLYGNCYIMQVEDNAANILQTGTICANDVTTKTISLSGISIPDDWLTHTWSHVINRNKTNEVNNGLTMTVQKSTAPYDLSVFVYNNAIDTPTFSQWYNFTNVSGYAIVNVTGRASDEAIYFDAYENDVIVFTDVSFADPSFGDVLFPSTNFGLLFALPVTMVMPILVAAVFPKRYGYFATIIVLAVIGLLAVFRVEGFDTLPSWFWAIAVPVGAVSVLVGYKRS